MFALGQLTFGWRDLLDILIVAILCYYGIRFVRGAPRPVAVVSEDGRCRLKFSEPETVLGATLAVTAGFTAEGKDD